MSLGSQARAAARTLMWAVVGLGVGMSETRADLTLTPDGVNQGLTLSTFASGFPTASGVGPLGIAFPTTGGVLVSDYPGNVRLFPTDTDGQSAGSVPPTAVYAGANAIDMAQVGGAIYMTQQAAGTLIQINND